MSESSSILEELWRTKEKIAAQYATLREYFEALVQRQNAANLMRAVCDEAGVVRTAVRAWSPTQS